MNRDGIDAVTAIAMEDPKRIGIWVSSTPIGKREFFYDVCTKPSTGYKAYHFPSMVNPHYNRTQLLQARTYMYVRVHAHLQAEKVHFSVAHLQCGHSCGH